MAPSVTTADSPVSGLSPLAGLFGAMVAAWFAVGSALLLDLLWLQLDPGAAAAVAGLRVVVCLAAWTLFALVGLLAGFTAGLLRYLMLRLVPRRPWISAALVGLVVVGALAAVLRPSTWHYQQLLWWLSVLTGAAALLVSRFRTLLAGRWRSLWVMTLLAVFLSTHLLDRFVLVRLYRHLHAALALVGVLALYAAWLGTADQLVRAIDRHRRRAAIVLLLASLATIGGVWVVSAQQSARLVVATRLVVGAKMLRLLHASVDLDQDGFSPLMGGGDCNDLDASVNPGQNEIPGNGRDDNCNGGDFAGAFPAFTRHAARLSPPLHLILITVDAMRADAVHLLAKRSNRMPTPAVDRLAGESVAFLRAYAPYSRTTSSLNALLSSRMHRNLYRGLRGTRPNLLDALTRAGFRLHFFIGQQRWRTVSQFFNAILNGPRALGAPDLAPILNTAGQRRQFIWVHLFDLHDPQFFGRRGFHGMGAPDRPAYDAGVRRMDGHLGRLLTQLDRLGMRQRVLVIFSADHGEELGEHGGRFHASSIYEEQVRIPLLVRFPGVTPRRVGYPVSLLDLYPTLAELYQLTIGPRILGRSLVPELLGRRGVRATLPVPIAINRLSPRYPNGNLTQSGVVDGHYKLIYRTMSNVFELYDLQRDPAEQRNIFDRHPDRVARLRRWHALVVDAME